MHDEYFMNTKTGEILPGSQAITEYYKTHGIFDAWTDEWEPTGEEVQDSVLEKPDFTNVFNF